MANVNSTIYFLYFGLVVPRIPLKHHTTCQHGDATSYIISSKTLVPGKTHSVRLELIRAVLALLNGMKQLSVWLVFVVVLSSSSMVQVYNINK